MARRKWRHCWIGLFLFFACERIASYRNIIVLDNCQWPVDKVLAFTFQIKDIAQPYNISLLVKNTQDYPYQNICITHHLENDAGHLLQKALKNYPLFDLKTGKPLGSGLWQSKKHEFSVTDGHQFSHTGVYTLKIEHFMRTDTLPGIQAVGIKVAPSKQHPQ